MITYRTLVSKEHLSAQRELTLLLLCNMQFFATKCYTLFAEENYILLGVVIKQYFVNYDRLIEHIGVNDKCEALFNLMTSCGEWCRERGLEIRPAKELGASRDADWHYVEPRKMHSDMCRLRATWKKLLDELLNKKEQPSNGGK